MFITLIRRLGRQQHIAMSHSDSNRTVLKVLRVLRCAEYENVCCSQRWESALSQHRSDFETLTAIVCMCVYVYVCMCV